MSPRSDPRAELDRIASKESRTVIGLMSGTSADGITACALRLAGFYTNTRPVLLGFRTYPYSKALRERIFSLFDPETARLDEVCAMNFTLGKELARASRSLADSINLSTDQIDAIGSHGQTIYHFPKPSGSDQTGSSLQIGELAVIAEITGVMTIGDFRKRDLAAGGEGAPLSPYVDFILYRNQEIGIAIQNIGGIANVAYLPPKCSEDEVIAFDTGPGNMIVDGLVNSYTRGESNYDADGAIAARGHVDKGLLDELLEDPYFSRPPPKSTGRESFGARYVGRYLHSVMQRGISREDAIATATMLTVESIARAYEDFVRTKGPLDVVYLAGGGAKNSTMVNWLARRMPESRIRHFDELGLPSEAREAAYMAILANEFIMGHTSNLPSATGAERKVILGTLVPGS